ncbi:thioredoxin-like protein [Fomes fomentarius]|nr:thioredoxin-like protein [Fomes fomentarius]
MFKAFTRSIPELSIFHNPSSPASTNALRLLRAAVSSPYPPSKPSAPPLEFNLEVIENKPPTPDQLRTILSYLPSKSPTGPGGLASTPSPDVLISAHPTVDSRPTDAEGVAKLASQNPHALKWPIVVDWHSGRAAVGDVEAVKSLLEELRKKRDGET